jgi:hypothetical protein
MADSPWWEERLGHYFCKADGVPLIRKYKPRDHKGGWMEEPPRECPICHRELNSTKEM